MFLNVYNVLILIFFRFFFLLYGNPPMNRNLIARVVKVTAPITFIGAAIVFFANVFFGNFIPSAICWGLYAVSLVNLYFSWAGSHPYTNFDGKCNTNFREAAALIIFAPFIFGVSALSGTDGNIDGNTQFTAFLIVMGIMMLTMIGAWMMSVRVSRRYKQDWLHAQRLSANTALVEALDNMKGLAAAKRDQIEAHAATLSTAEVWELARSANNIENAPDILK